MYGTAKSLLLVATLVLSPMDLAAIAVSTSSMPRVYSGRITTILSVGLTTKTSRYHSRKMLQVFQAAMDTKSPSPSRQLLAAKAAVARPLPLRLKARQQDRWRPANQSPTQLPALTVQSSRRLARSPPPSAQVPVKAVKVVLTLAPSLLG